MIDSERREKGDEDGRGSVGSEGSGKQGENGRARRENGWSTQDGYPALDVVGVGYVCGASGRTRSDRPSYPSVGVELTPLTSSSPAGPCLLLVPSSPPQLTAQESYSLCVPVPLELILPVPQPLNQLPHLLESLLELNQPIIHIIPPLPS